ncbi:GerAB/ArcD/ProY family transporter [Paenibacillus eucommiae]|uniref:Spore germination protein (Amino acid permease) n=1 Tax=Paenibacillus eucommiae TaxID=1355755 RepID=A0ABS4IXT5_9BACL|nr:endospore germination permease [Paenibacillus eucommiae]MBP1991900.1 spore germination protein (amino acid permease) [Paenibacillus eucommiae]
MPKTKATTSISMLQAYLLIITSVGFMNHVLIIPILFDRAGRDAWISVIVACLLLLLLLPLIHMIATRTGDKSLFQWIKQKIGVKAAWIVYFPVVIYLCCIIGITLKDTLDWLRVTYLPHTPSIIITSCILLTCVLSARSGLRSIAIMNGILLPFVVIFGFFVMAGNQPHKDYALLLPIFEHGYRPAAYGTLYAWGGLLEIVMILWIKQHIHSSLRKRSLLLLTFILAGLTLGPIIGAISEFGSIEAVKQRYPAYEEWRLVQIGKYIEHLDFLSLYQWLSGAIIRISIALYLILDIAGLRGSKKRTTILLYLSFGVLAFAHMPVSDSFFVETLSRFYFPTSVVFILMFLIFVGVLVFWHKEKSYE